MHLIYVTSFSGASFKGKIPFFNIISLFFISIALCSDGSRPFFSCSLPVNVCESLLFNYYSKKNQYYFKIVFLNNFLKYSGYISFYEVWFPSKIEPQSSYKYELKSKINLAFLSQKCPFYQQKMCSFYHITFLFILNLLNMSAKQSFIN